MQNVMQSVAQKMAAIQKWRRKNLAPIQNKNGSDAICDADAPVSRSVMLMVKRLAKKRADADRENGTDVESFAD